MSKSPQEGPSPTNLVSKLSVCKLTRPRGSNIETPPPGELQELLLAPIGRRSQPFVVPRSGIDHRQPWKVPKGSMSITSLMNFGITSGLVWPLAGKLRESRLPKSLFPNYESTGHSPACPRLCMQQTADFRSKTFAETTCRHFPSSSGSRRQASPMYGI